MNSQLNSIDLVDDQSLNQVTNVEFHLPVNPNFSNLDIVNKLQLNSRNRCVLKVILNGKYVDMEIETGSEIYCMSKKTYDSLGLVGSTLTKCSEHLTRSVERNITKRRSQHILRNWCWHGSRFKQ